MRYLFFILLIQHFALICKADDCKKVPKAELFRRADAVFLGTILSVNDSSFEVQVTEIYKGGYLKDTLTGLINQDVVLPKAFTIWLFYAKKIDDGVFLADFCSGSKGFDDPHGAHDTTFPPPPPSPNPSPAQLFAIGQTIRGNALGELYFEIETLRASAQQERLLSRLDQIQQEKAVMSNQVTWLTRTIYGIFAVLLALAFILYRKMHG